eukprot:103974_1
MSKVHLIDLKKWISAEERKKIFCCLFEEQFKRFYDPISKGNMVREQDFLNVAATINIFDDITKSQLAKYLFEKLLEDIERIHPWTCDYCHFINRKVMVDGMWRLYNQLRSCGLCGTCRHCKKDHLTVPSAKGSRQPLKYNAIDLPPCVKKKWSLIHKIGKECQYVRSEKQLYLENFDNTDEMTSWLIQRINKMSISDKDIFNQKIQNGISIKELIVNYLKRNKIDGQKFCKTFLGRKNFINKMRSIIDYKTNRIKVGVPVLGRLYNIIINNSIHCAPLKRVCCILEHYQDLTIDLNKNKYRYPYDIKAFLCELVDYDPTKLLDDIDHIFDGHMDDKYLLGNQPYVQCNNDNCKHIKRAERDADKSKALEEKQEFFNCNNWKDYVYISCLDRFHSILLHGDKTKVLCGQLHKDAKTIHKYNKYFVYHHGIYVQYSSSKPLYSNFKQELTRNRGYCISENLFHKIVKDAHNKMQTDKWKEQEKTFRAKETNEMYGIIINDPISIESVLALILYCSNSEYCRVFRSSYRSIDCDDIHSKVYKFHLNNFYWFGRFIFVAIRFFGVTVENVKEKPFYHGLGKIFLFSSYSTNFETPTSTTKDINIARRKFTNDGAGIVLTLGTKFNNDQNFCKCLDVEIFSNYAEENERLFAGLSVLSIIDIEFPDLLNRKRISLKCHIDAILYLERITEQTIHQRDYYNYGHLKKHLQKKYLIPLIRHQMKRNENNFEMKENKVNEVQQYVFALFEHFCDSQREYIDLSCIKYEI